MTILQQKCSLFLPMEQYECDDRTMGLLLEEHEFVEVWNSGELPCSVHEPSSLPCSASAGHRGCQQLLHCKRKAPPCPGHPTAALFRSVPQDSQQCPRADHCTAHRDEGAPHKESPAQLPEADVCCHHGCVAVLVPETAPASAAGCSPSQSLPAVWGRHSPAHQEITSDNSGKHVCYPFMRASNPGPNSGCAKRFSPEEMCLLINIY